MRALWSDRPNCSHNVSQKVKRIRRVSDSGGCLHRGVAGFKWRKGSFRCMKKKGLENRKHEVKLRPPLCAAPWSTLWLRWPGDSHRESGRFARMDSQEKEKTIFITFERFARITSNLRFAIFKAPKCDSQKKGCTSEPWDGSRARILREAKPGGFQTRGFPTFFGNGPDCVADPFGTVPQRCS